MFVLLFMIVQLIMCFAHAYHAQDAYHAQHAQHGHHYDYDDNSSKYYHDCHAYATTIQRVCDEAYCLATRGADTWSTKMNYYG